MNFPDGFSWGVSTAAHQIEGAWLEGGKGLSIWDAFAHTPGRIKDGTTADVACDHYHRYKEDAALMKSAGIRHYRFSLAWTRIMPAGRGAINREGVKFYSDLIDELLANGITPWVTLYHWDLPLALQTELDGWCNPMLPDLFADYAAVCFEHFGDRVKHWITLNEPWVTAVLGHGLGELAPGRISRTEPYLVGHQLLRGHMKASAVYRTRFQTHQKGRIGLSLNCDWREPLTDSALDQAAAQRSLEFFLGWFADPIYRGDYPPVMRERLSQRLPAFSAEEVALLKDSSQFFGLNTYSTRYASHRTLEELRKEAQGSAFANAGLVEDQEVHLSADPAWPTMDFLDWPMVPWGCHKLLKWIDHRYGRPEIVITENGCGFIDPIEHGRINDARRISFHDHYIRACRAAIDDGVNLKGYFIWTLMDNFEWTQGYTARFGLCHIDEKTQARLPKESLKWYGAVSRNNGLSVPG